MTKAESLIENLIPLEQELEERFNKTFTYLHPSRQQLNSLSDKLVSQGFLSPDGRIIQYPEIDSQFVYAQVANCSNPFRMMGAFEHYKGLAVYRLLKNGIDAIRCGDLLIAFTSVRLIIE